MSMSEGAADFSAAIDCAKAVFNEKGVPFTPEDLIEAAKVILASGIRSEIESVAQSLAAISRIFTTEKGE